MVRLTRIYTKTGDDGTTGLGDGTRLPKHHLRVEAYGTVDELNAVIGSVTAQGLDEPLQGHLRAIQNDLFDVGADLCMPGKAGDRLRIKPVYTQKLEELIDTFNEELEPLNSFVLPGGALQAARLHLARTVCRRAERMVTALQVLDEEQDAVNLEILRYLNRLSDLLFVLARFLNDKGKSDVLWKPGERLS